MVSKFDPMQAAATAATPTCPKCGTVLPAPKPTTITSPPSDPDQIPNPNELPEEPEPQQGEPEDDDTLLSVPLISGLEDSRADDPPLDSSLLKTTSDEDLASKAIRVKRKSARVEKQLTSWDDRDPGDEESGQRRRPTPAWVKGLKVAAIAVVPVALLILIVYGVLASMKDKPEVEREPEVTAVSLARDRLSELERASLARSTSKEVFLNARAVAEQFLKAETWEQRRNFVREPDRVAPLMQEHYAKPGNPDGAIPYRELPEDSKLAVHNSLLLLSVEMEDFTRRPLAVEQVSADQFLVDWESWVGHCGVPWDELDERRPSEPFLLRARIKERDYYNYGFQDDRWASWQLEDLNGDHRIFGYVDSTGPLMIRLATETRREKKAIYVLLKVRFPEDAPAGDQVEITEFVARGWVSPSISGD